MNNIYDIRNFKVTSQNISFELKNEKIQIPLKETESNLLISAQKNQLQIFEIDLDGIGIYWPLIDEDLSISGLLRSAGRKDLIVKRINSIYPEKWKKHAA